MPDRNRNDLLRRLSRADYEKLASDLTPVALAFKEALYEQGGTITHVFFPTSGVISLLTLLTDDDEPIETGTVGREGMVGVSALLGAPRAPGRALCQIAGGGLRMPTDRFLLAADRIGALHALVLRYTSVLMAMTAQSAACNRVHETRARMARWLLMTHDRVDRDDFPLTQEFLGQMLGVRRPAVSVAGASLQRERLIKYTRGRITVLDRRGLERAACACYAYVRREFVAHFGKHSATG